MSAWEADAELFGKAGSKAFLAMLAARCVEPNNGNSAVDPSENSEGKSSAKAFARVSGRSDKTITRYVATWDLLAEAGHVSSRDELAPGVDVDLPAAKTWTEFYRKANPPKPRAETPDDVTLEQAEAELAADPTVRLVPVPQGRHVGTYVQRMKHATEDIFDRAPDAVADAVLRLVDCLEALSNPDQTNRAYLHSLDAVAELAAAYANPR
ncbi:hypothetical protein OG455_39010 [Kitasatospora sp. NBC_01287]|uniref:hypothetical protein n=1 Tax=Kitasatospora sp. NBC_01287 TaxID=2903573 RepID=UPI0022589CAD|nr:hypothetical protein [Kitasatospora sp. NBC_01287]MCX4751426.1 hypothetical protein [Kitasatospora sp. NBC_01287]